MENATSLREFIRQSINSVAFDELRNHKTKVAAASPKAKVDHSMNEEEVDTFLFYGGRRPEIENKKKPTKKQ